MGTGSHRPQWEAAKGRPDVLGGIKHARALKSHSKLKYRDTVPRPGLRKEITTSQGALPSVQPELDTPKGISPASYADQSATDNITAADNSSESSEDSEDSEVEQMRLELERLSKRDALRAQLAKSKTAPSSSWRSDTAFSRRKPKPKSKPTPKSSHADFLDKFVH